MKRARKAISILVTLAMLVGLLLPMGAPAFAATNNRVDKVISVADDFDGVLGNKITIEEDSDYQGDWANDETIRVVLPAGVEWKNTTTVTGDVYTGTGYASGYKIVNDQTIEIITVGASVYKNSMVITPAIKVDGATGDIKVTIDGRDSAISSTELLLARVSGGKTTTKAMDVKTIGESGTGGTIQIDETAVMSMKTGSQTVTLKLPSNFKWDSAMAASDITFGGGFTGLTATGLTGQNTRSLTFTIAPVAGRVQRGTIYIAPKIVAEKDASFGEIEVNVSGTNVDDADVIVAKYANFGITLEMKEVKTRVAGTFDAKTEELTIEELVPGTLIKDRKVNLEFPTWVKVTKATVVSETGIGFSAPSYDGTDNEVEFTVTTASSGTTKGKVKLKFELSIQADKSGDIEVKFSGKAGATGSIVVAKAVAPVTATASAPAQLKIGVKNQPVGDIVIKENKDETFFKPGNLVVELPDNIEFSSKPTVEVIEGNGEIDKDGVSKSGNVLTIPIKNTSSKATAIKISGIKVDINRVVPEGVVEADIKGSAIVRNDKDQNGWLNGAAVTTGNAGVDVLQAGEFDKSVAASVVIGTVVTPAPEAGTVLFNIGSTVYTAGGVTKVMDAAPYIKEGRTYVPVRYLALALGVTEDNIKYENGVVTLVKGDVTLKLTIGSKSLDKNGAVTTMDVAPEVVNGRTMLPARFVAEGFGALVGYANGQVVISY